MFDAIIICEECFQHLYESMPWRTKVDIKVLARKQFDAEGNHFYLDISSAKFSRQNKSIVKFESKFKSKKDFFKN